MGWLEDAVERGVEVWHPKEEVGALVARLWQREVKYESFRREEEAGDRRELDDRREGRQKGKDQWVLGEGEWSCRLLVGGEVVVEVSGWNRMEVESRAAEMAVVKLRRNAGTARSELEKVVEEQVAEERLSEDMKGRNEQEGLVDDEEDVDGVTLGDPTRSEGGALLGMGLDGVMELVEGNIAMEASRKRKDRND